MFLVEKDFDITLGPWTPLVAVTLFTIIEVSTMCFIQLTSKNRF